MMYQSAVNSMATISIELHDDMLWTRNELVIDVVSNADYCDRHFGRCELYVIRKILMP